MAEAIEDSMASVTLDDLVAKHRREKKELQAKIQALKKNAPKSKRKEAMEEVTHLESDLEKRHATELKTLTEKLETTNRIDIQINNATAENHQSNIKVINNIDDDTVIETETPRISKAQKRRDKKAREKKEREETQRENLVNSSSTMKTQEMELFELKLSELQLALHEVPGDGDCLYNAVRHQVMQRGLGVYSVKQLREETANYIRANKETLHFYMTNPQTGDLLTDEEFEDYCEAVRKKPTWGGEVELKALSTVLRVPIEVLQAKGPSTIHGADAYPGPNLKITYHRHLLSLGEHYNSTKPLEESDA